VFSIFFVRKVVSWLFSGIGSKMRLVIAHIPLEGSERSKRWMPLLGNAYKNSLNHVERVEWDRTG